MQEIASDAVYFKDKSKDNLRKKSEKKTKQFNTNIINIFFQKISIGFYFALGVNGGLWVSFISLSGFLSKEIRICGDLVLKYLTTLHLKFGENIKCYRRFV